MDRTVFRRLSRALTPRRPPLTILDVLAPAREPWLPVPRQRVPLAY